MKTSAYNEADWAKIYSPNPCAIASRWLKSPVVNEVPITKVNKNQAKLNYSIKKKEFVKQTTT